MHTNILNKNIHQFMMPVQCMQMTFKFLFLNFNAFKYFYYFIIFCCCLNAWLMSLLFLACFCSVDIYFCNLCLYWMFHVWIIFLKCSNDVSCLKWFGSSFQICAALYQKEFKPYLVVRTLSKTALSWCLKLYFWV
jgi:hypothetical protein